MISTLPELSKFLKNFEPIDGVGFNMDNTHPHWSPYPAVCIGGWIIIENGLPRPHNSGAAIATIEGVTPEQAADLAYSPEDTRHATAYQAHLVIEHLIQTGEVDWYGPLA